MKFMSFTSYKTKARKVEGLGPGVWEHHDHSAVKRILVRNFPSQNFQLIMKVPVRHTYQKKKLHRTNIPSCSSNTSAAAHFHM